MKNRTFLPGMLAVTLALGLVFTGCNTGGEGGEEESGGNTLPASKGVNALSGKIYVDWSNKIEFSVTAEGAKNGSYKKLAVKYGENNSPVLASGKYTYTEIETGYYSWDATAKTVTLGSEKVAIRNGNGDGPLQTRAEYRTTAQNAINKEIAGLTQQEVDEGLAEMGFSSIAAYLDYVVAEAFKNVTNNYAFSADSKALFLDEALPASKGTNELTGQTYYGTNKQAEKDASQTYVFAGTTCTYTQTGNNYTTTYNYAYDSTAKRVYLKTPTTNRDYYYNFVVSSNTPNSSYFASVDEYNAAQVNNQYNRLEEYIYNTAEKTLRYY